MSGTATGRLRQPVALVQQTTSLTSARGGAQQEHMYERQLLADMGHLEDQYESLRASEKEEHVRLVDAQQQLQDFATQREEALLAAAAAEAGTREMKAFVGGSFVFFLVFCACAHGCDPARFRESYNPQGASDANALLHVAMKDAPNKSDKDERQGQPLETPRTTEADQRLPAHQLPILRPLKNLHLNMIWRPLAAKRSSKMLTISGIMRSTRNPASQLSAQ